MHDTPGATLGGEAATPSAPQGGATLGDCGGGLTIAALAAARGISKDAARRLLRAGKLRAHRTLGPYGPAWCIHPDDPWRQGSDQGPETATGALGVRQGVTREGGARGAPGVAASPVLAPADAMVSLIQTTIATVLAPLVAELAASRQANERQAETVREQAETIGELRATIATLTAPESPLMARTVPQPPDPTTGAPWTRWRAVPPWLFTALAITAVVVLLLVPALR